MNSDGSSDHDRLIALEAVFYERWGGHTREHELLAEGLRAAKVDVDQRLDSMNQLRDQITAERGEFVRRDMYDREHATLRDAHDSRIKALETAKSNLDGRIWAVGAVVAVLSIAFEFMLKYFMKG